MKNCKYYDVLGNEIHEGDYVKLNQYEEPKKVHTWKDEYGNVGLGIDATNPAWIASGRAVECEFGIYPFNELDMSECRLVK